MTWTYDLGGGSPKDQVRLMIGDTDDQQPDAHFFEDEEIEAFLSMESGEVKLATAQALDTLASSEAMIQKKITLLDLTTDGPAVAAELRARASELREQFYSGDEDLPDWAEMVLDPHTFSERVWKDAQRHD